MLDQFEPLWKILELSPPWHTIWPQCADEGVRLRRRRRRRWSHLATSGVVKYSAAVIIFFVAESPGPANDVCEREALLSIGSSIG